MHNIHIPLDHIHSELNTQKSNQVSCGVLVLFTEPNAPLSLNSPFGVGVVGGICL